LTTKNIAAREGTAFNHLSTSRCQWTHSVKLPARRRWDVARDDETGVGCFRAPLGIGRARSSAPPQMLSFAVSSSPIRPMILPPSSRARLRSPPRRALTRNTRRFVATGAMLTGAWLRTFPRSPRVIVNSRAARPIVNETLRRPRSCAGWRRTSDYAQFDCEADGRRERPAPQPARQPDGAVFGRDRDRRQSSPSGVGGQGRQPLGRASKRRG